MIQARPLAVSLGAVLLATTVAPAATGAPADDAPPLKPCSIQVVEKGTGWPVPLVILRTTHNVRLVTDNAGVAAFDLPELMGRQTWLYVHSPGYEVPKDGFGYRGVRVTPEPGKTLRVEVTRTSIAKRLGRLTGGGLFAESRRCGREAGPAESGVLGCDSVQTAVHRGRLYWAWGDTILPHYPLGIFHMSSATTAVRPLESLKPPVHLEYDYFRDDAGRPRGVCRMPGDGPTWASGYVSLPDAGGTPRLVATYAKIKPPLEAYEYGLCVWNEAAARFEPHKTVWTKSDEAPEPPPVPTGQPLFGTDPAGKRWVLFGDPLPTLRCPATFEAWEDPSTWEVLTPPESLTSAGDGKPVKPHSGNVVWNPFRKRYVTVFMQWFGKPSVFGELWYAEADAPTGPWGKAVKVLSHENYTFYNPRIHPELTPPDSPVLLFEGTYTQQFADDPRPTPRYDYNQILYRLDLDDPALAPAREPVVKDDRNAEAKADRAPAAKAEATAVREQSPPALLPVRLSEDGRGFVLGDTGRPFRPWGFNYDHDADGRLIEDYWAGAWPTVAADFREMKDLGANVVRIHLQLGRFMAGPEEADAGALGRLARLVRLAEETRLYLDLTGLGCYHKPDVPAWYDAMGEADRWAVQARFWDAVAGTCAASPAVFCYDLMNEPVLPGKGKPETEWLAGAFGGKHFVQRIALDLAGRTRKEVAKAWVEKLVSAIRARDPRTLVTVGVIPWAIVWPRAKPIFYAPEVGGPLDFVSVHLYPRKGEVDAALRALAVYDVGKPVVVEETFPLKCGMDEMVAFIERSRPVADGYLTFYRGKTIEEYGENPPDIASAITKAWLERFRAMGPGT
ncbi:MAG: cellulase family glycosylhydrolase [Phycisphaerae bacterium]